MNVNRILLGYLKTDGLINPSFSMSSLIQMHLSYYKSKLEANVSKYHNVACCHGDRNNELCVVSIGGGFDFRWNKEPFHPENNDRRNYSAYSTVCTHNTFTFFTLWKDIWMSTVVLYCWYHSDCASVLLYFTLEESHLDGQCTRGIQKLMQ